MKLRIFVYRLAAAATAFILGVGFFSVGQYFQTPETDAVQPAVEQETVSVTPRTMFVPFPVEPTTGGIIGSQEDTKREFDAAGDYYIIGDLPKGFKDFDGLSIETKNYEKASAENDYVGMPIPPEGYVSTKKKFKFARINIADKQISFETEAKKGISYKFVGKFIDEEEITVGEYPEYIVLKGRLVKMRDGKKIAESEVKIGTVMGC
jgi:hypothetical protein